MQSNGGEKLCCGGVSFSSGRERPRLVIAVTATAASNTLQRRRLASKSFYCFFFFFTAGVWRGFAVNTDDSARPENKSMVVCRAEGKRAVTWTTKIPQIIQQQLRTSETDSSVLPNSSRQRFQLASPPTPLSGGLQIDIKRQEVRGGDESVLQEPQKKSTEGNMEETLPLCQGVSSRGSTCDKRAGLIEKARCEKIKNLHLKNKTVLEMLHHQIHHLRNAHTHVHTHTHQNQHINISIKTPQMSK